MITITKSGSKLTVRATKYKGKNIEKKTFDLKGHEGKRVRVHIDTNNKLTTEIKSKQEEIICALDIPEKEYEHTKTTKKDNKGEYIIETKEKELDLSKVKIKEYPEEEEK